MSSIIQLKIIIIIIIIIPSSTQMPSHPSPIHTMEKEGEG
jgi:hypothetical protein